MAWKPKYSPDPPKKRRRSIDPLVGFAVVLAIVVGAVGVDWLVRYLSESAVRAQLPQIIRPTGHRAASYLTVVDGDTVRSGGITYRLVGFDTPESGDRAQCDRERQLAERASQRLRSLVQAGVPKLERVACACKPGTEGTESCDYGRSCAYLRIGGKDVGETLISEGLAQRFVCGATSCPPRRPWC